MSSVAILAKNPDDIQAQLPVSWYLQPEIYALEQQYLFSQAPKYVGHALMVPHAGDFHVLDWMHGAKSLVNREGEITLLSNVCRHRQAVMLTGRGNTEHIVCPLHRWTYDLNGKLLGAPKFNENPCLHLQKTALENWQGLLFEAPHGIAKELDAMACKQDIDFSAYQFHSVKVEHYNFNWKTFIEVYLEDYHVGPFHPGLNQLVDCNDLQWEFAKNFSAQTVGYKSAPHHHPSPAYQKWQAAIAKFYENKPAKHGAIWMVYYPFLMIEWYPGVLVVSHLIPTGVETCSNVVEFYYPEEIAGFEHAFIAAQQAAYQETADEDREICERMHQGRKGLFAKGIDERGPYQHPLESGLAHFHLWYRRQMEQYL